VQHSLVITANTGSGIAGIGFHGATPALTPTGFRI